MMKLTVIVLVLSGVLGVQMCYGGAHPVRVDEHSNCVECHADHATGDYVHPALKSGCISCHQVENDDDTSYVAAQPKDFERLPRVSPAGADAAPAFPIRLRDVHPMPRSTCLQVSRVAAGEGKRCLPGLPPAGPGKTPVAISADHRAHFRLSLRTPLCAAPGKRIAGSHQGR